MQKSLLLAIFLSFAVYGVAQEHEEETPTELGSELPSEPASQEAVNLAKEACETWAVADEIPESDLGDYMRTCIDDELEYHGYRPLNARSGSN